MIETVKTPPTRKPDVEGKIASPPVAGIFAELERARSSEPAWLNAIRKAGISHFVEKGFPSIKDEEWRFTNVAPIAELPFQPATVANGQPAAKELQKLLIPGLSGSRLVFVNGLFSPELSKINPELKGIAAGSLAAALAKNPAALEPGLGRFANCEENSFVALNTAFFADGAFISVPAGRVLQEPIHLVFVAAPGAATHYHPRNLFHLAKGAQVAIIEHYVSLRDGEANHLTNAVTEIILEEGAVAEHCKLQTEDPEAFHVATVQARLDKNSRLLTHSISIGGRIARNNINLVLNGEGVDVVLNGLYMGIGDQLIDHHTVVDHAKPRCGSHEFYHGILDGRSKGVFNGKIFVRPDAQKTDAKQTNRGLLLSKDATIDTKPQLEIFADDVKCTHGATIGQLNEEEIFYLRSRGIGLDNARKILVHAFASDVINRIKHEPVRAQLEEMISSRLDDPRAE